MANLAIRHYLGIGFHRGSVIEICRNIKHTYIIAHQGQKVNDPFTSIPSIPLGT
jgi:hypothetical protein